MARGKKYYIIYKPKGCLSQFSKEHGKMALVDYFVVESDVYPVGRLDEDSEGLLILTNDKTVNAQLLDPMKGHWRTYWVQVAGQINKQAIKKIEAGVEIVSKGKVYQTMPAKVKKSNPPKSIPPMEVAVKNTSWVKISLQEGKYRQVRKMTAKVGFPTLRLIRTHIEELDLGDLKPGESKSLEKKQLFSKVKLPF